LKATVDDFMQKFSGSYSSSVNKWTSSLHVFGKLDNECFRNASCHVTEFVTLGNDTLISKLLFYIEY